MQPPIKCPPLLGGQLSKSSWGFFYCFSLYWVVSPLLSKNHPFPGGWLFCRGWNVRLFSNYKEQKSDTMRYPSVSLMFLPHFVMSCLINYWTDAWQRGIYLFYIIKKPKKCWLCHLFNVGLSLLIDRTNQFKFENNLKDDLWGHLIIVSLRQSNIMVLQLSIKMYIAPWYSYARYAAIT